MDVRSLSSQTSHDALDVFARVDSLILPGWQNSGPDHWQSHWEHRLPHARRVEQGDWDKPDVASWVQAIDQAVRQTTRPPLFIAHSLGCIAVAHWASTIKTTTVVTAFLVAPADVEQPTAPPAVQGFAPIPTMRLPFPATVVASRSDEWMCFDRAADFAQAWGADLVDLAEAGHINTAAGYGPWNDGLELLRPSVTRALARAHLFDDHSSQGPRA